VYAPTELTGPILQDAVLRFLANPDVHGVAEIRRFDTHASVVLLAGNLAIKIKRAIRFPYLDYSTLEKRRAACNAELEINRKFAPQLYRRVVPITREPDGAFRYDGTGEPVEWAVEMVRFDENQTLDCVADRGEFDMALAGKLGAGIGVLQERAPVADAAAWLSAIERFVERNTLAFREHPALFPDDHVAELDTATRLLFLRLRPLLANRGRAGLVRRGHGDLHLGNIVLLQGDPVAFDAIEFDPIVASGDVLYELAFPLMDLVERGLVSAANGVLNAYFRATKRPEDFEGIAALPLFMSLRAAIRANVIAARLDQAGSDRRSLSESARHYFQLALDLLMPSTASVVAIGGLSGTGKSVLACALAPHIGPPPGALVLRSDVERKMMFGVPETERLSAEAYKPNVSDAVYRRLLDKAGRAARAGHSVVVDAVFADADERADIEGEAVKNGATFQGLYLVAPLHIRALRVKNRSADASDADAAVARRQEQLSVGQMTWKAIDASGSPESTLSAARSLFLRE
jgi:uncharacterized protein